MNTSTLAHENYKPKKPNDYNLILSVLDKEKGMTYKEIGYKIYTKLLLANEKEAAWSWKFDPNKVSRRMKELERQEKASVLEVRKCTKAGSMCKSYIKA